MLEMGIGEGATGVLVTNVKELLMPPPATKQLMNDSRTAAVCHWKGTVGPKRFTPTVPSSVGKLHIARIFSEGCRKSVLTPPPNSILAVRVHN